MPTCPVARSTADTCAADPPRSSSWPRPPHGAPYGPPANPNAFNLAYTDRRGSCHSSAPPTPRSPPATDSMNRYCRIGTWPGSQPALVALGHIHGDGVMRPTGQLANIPQQPARPNASNMFMVSMFMVSSRGFTRSSCSTVTAVVTGHSSRCSTPTRCTPPGDELQRGPFC